MWPLRVYTRKKRAGQRLNVTPAPSDLGAQAKMEAAPGLKGRSKARGLQKIPERAERSPPGGSGSGLASSHLRVTGEKSLRESTTREEALAAKTTVPAESAIEDLQVDTSSSDSELLSGLSLQHDGSSSLPSCSVTDSYMGCKSFEQSLSSVSSPELFRGSDLVWECPKMEEYMVCKNSTLLETSHAVAVEKLPYFSDLSAILGTSSEDYQKCCGKKGMVSAHQNVSSKSKNTSNVKSDNATCEALLAEKTCPSVSEKAKEKRTNSSTTDKKSTDLLTSTPASETASFVIDLSSIQKASSEELCPNVSTYVNSNEIVPVSSLQEASSNEFPSNVSEVCCIIRASPGTRQVKSKRIIVKKKTYSPPKGIPQDIIIKANKKT
ncbi:meiosis-specific kinetochore protein [Ochotona curzoniae]|uniref:meiosis-specific kinetochore protein n=1 Tax=Ochotona curzoniae TaxID=130825 RepID=UPI001B34D731|nr:meiosis-specific kinetochore protein [Ochotona curzoniae]